jgi:hypothetical protein
MIEDMQEPNHQRSMVLSIHEIEIIIDSLEMYINYMSDICDINKYKLTFPVKEKFSNEKRKYFYEFIKAYRDKFPIC